MKEMTLKEVCELLNVSRRQVQGYEGAHMVSATDRNKYGYLLYNEDAVERIRYIKQHQNFGFALKEIKEMLMMPEKEYISKLEIKYEELKIQLNQLMVRIEELENLIGDKKKLYN